MCRWGRYTVAMRRRATTLIAPLLVLAAAALVAFQGCAAARTATDVPPPDFAVSVTVADRARPATAAERPRALRAARYIVEPDGLLRASVGPGSLTSTFPPPMRQLSAAQMTELWGLVSGAGYLRLDPATQSADAETVATAVTRPTAMIYVAGNEARRSLQVPLETAQGEPARSLVDRLAELAWIREADGPAR